MKAAVAGRRLAVYFPARTDNRIVSRFGAGRARTDVGEVVAHEIHDFHRVVAVTNFRHRQDDRLVFDVEPRSGIQRVVVGAPA